MRQQYSFVQSVFFAQDYTDGEFYSQWQENVRVEVNPVTGFKDSGIGKFWVNSAYKDSGVGQLLPRCIDALKRDSKGLRATNKLWNLIKRSLSLVVKAQTELCRKLKI